MQENNHWRQIFNVESCKQFKHELIRIVICENTFAGRVKQWHYGVLFVPFNENISEMSINIWLLDNQFLLMKIYRKWRPTIYDWTTNSFKESISEIIANDIWCYNWKIIYSSRLHTTRDHNSSSLTSGFNRQWLDTTAEGYKLLTTVDFLYNCVKIVAAIKTLWNLRRMSGFFVVVIDLFIAYLRYTC